MEEAKLVRRQKKAAITRHLRTLNRLVAEENIKEAKTKLDKLQNSFKEFENSHYVYNDTLENEEEVEVSDQWFEDVQSIYTTGVKAGRSWLKAQEPNPQIGQKSEEGDTSMMSHVDLAKLMSVPKVEIDKFDGNPLEYQTFIAVFEEVVDSNVDDGQVKLTRLLQ